MRVASCALCRRLNTAYTSLETRRQILAKVRRRLAPDGYLLLGSTENLLQTPEGFASVDIDGSLFYRPLPD
jgi:chemotaxis protein methyltransferase CheR